MPSFAITIQPLPQYNICYIQYQVFYIFYHFDIYFQSLNYIENIALNIGRLTDVKQQIILLKIWNQLVNIKNIKNWKLYIVGGGELKIIFEEYITENSLQDYVFIFPPEKDISKFYKKASLFLLTSKSEGFGMVLLESISFGLPCISFDCPSGPRDIIKNDENGYLIEENNIEDLEKHIVKFISDPELKIQMGKASLLLSRNWDDSILLKQWHEILQ